MMRWIFIILLCAACDGPSTPGPRYLAKSKLRLLGLIENQCGPASPREHFELEDDPSLAAGYQNLHRLRCSLRLPDGRFTGPLSFAVQGSTMTGEACGIRIRSAPIRAPLSLDVVLAWLEDPELAGKLRDAVGQVDYNREYQISVTTEGVHIRMGQLAGVDG